MRVVLGSIGVYFDGKAWFSNENVFLSKVVKVGFRVRCRGGEFEKVVFRWFSFKIGRG